jgi:two-component sensor histidine kinase
VRTCGTWDIEHRFRGADGEWHPILARGVPVRDEEGRLLCWAGINLDISRLKRTEEHLRASLQEKEVLMQEIHHRVKNNLQVISSLINLQADTLNQPALRRSLDDVRDRIHTMALVHEKLYQSSDLARLNFAEYAASLLDYLWRAHGAPAARVRLTLATQPVTLPVGAAVSCGLILNELATNALKHAFPDGSEGEVTVGLAEDPANNRICLQVRDNGVGLPAGLNWRESRSLGLRLVQLLASQIEGTVEVGPGPGAEFRVAFFVPPKP